MRLSRLPEMSIWHPLNALVYLCCGGLRSFASHDSDRQTTETRESDICLLSDGDSYMHRLACETVGMEVVCTYPVSRGRSDGIAVYIYRVLKECRSHGADASSERPHGVLNGVRHYWADAKAIQ